MSKLLPEPKSTVVSSPTAQDKFAMTSGFNSPQQSQRASKGKLHSSSKVRAISCYGLLSWRFPQLGSFQNVPSTKEKAKENAGRGCSKFAVCTTCTVHHADVMLYCAGGQACRSGSEESTYACNTN